MLRVLFLLLKHPLWPLSGQNSGSERPLVHPDLALSPPAARYAVATKRCCPGPSTEQGAGVLQSTPSYSVRVHAVLSFVIPS